MVGKPAVRSAFARGGKGARQCMLSVDVGLLRPREKWVRCIDCAWGSAAHCTGRKISGRRMMVVVTFGGERSGGR